MELCSLKLVPLVVYLLIVASDRYGVSATERTGLFDDYDGSGWSEEDVTDFTEECEDYVMPCLVKCIWWALFLTTSIIGSLGNTAVVLTELCHPITKTGSRYLLFQMCISDTLAAVILHFPIFVQEVSDNWPFGTVFCGIMWISEIPLISTSTFSMFSLAVERFLSFLRPGKLPMTSKFAWKLVGFMWNFSITQCLPNLFYYKLSEFEEFGSNDTICHTEWLEDLHNQRMLFDLFHRWLHIILHVVPVILICYVYLWTSQLKWRSRSTDQGTHLVPLNLHENKKIFTITDALVFGSAACVLPFLLHDILRYITDTEYCVSNVSISFYWLFTCKVMICPIVYFCSNKRNGDVLPQAKGSERDCGCYGQLRNGIEGYSISTI